MPDGPSVEIRVTADTGGVDAVKARLDQLKSELGAVRSQMIAMGGATDDLRAKAAALTAQIGQTRAQLAGMASSAQESEAALGAAAAVPRRRPPASSRWKAPRAISAWNCATGLR